MALTIEQRTAEDFVRVWLSELRKNGTPHTVAQRLGRTIQEVFLFATYLRSTGVQLPRFPRALINPDPLNQLIADQGYPIDPNSLPCCGRAEPAHAEAETVR